MLNKLLIPHIPASQLMELATEECNKFTKNDVPTINYDIFVEMFADIAFKWIDTPSIRQLTKFIDMILERTTKIVAINVMGNSFLPVQSASPPSQATAVCESVRLPALLSLLLAAGSLFIRPAAC